MAQLLNIKYDILIATNPIKGLEIAKKQLPSLILLDIIMPEMDGYEVAKELKNNHQTNSIPFIFLSAKGSSQDTIDGFNHGAVDYISKPFIKEELLARIHTHLKIHSLNKFLIDNLAVLE